MKTAFGVAILVVLSLAFVKRGPSIMPFWKPAFVVQSSLILGATDLVVDASHQDDVGVAQARAAAVGKALEGDPGSLRTWTAQHPFGDCGRGILVTVASQQASTTCMDAVIVPDSNAELADILGAASEGMDEAVNFLFDENGDPVDDFDARVASLQERIDQVRPVRQVLVLRRPGTSEGDLKLRADHVIASLDRVGDATHVVTDGIATGCDLLMVARARVQRE